MTNIVQFPNKEEIFPPIPRRRVFYLGYRYTGGMCCQDVHNIYLKRKGILHGNRYWAIITYDKYNNYCSLELEECHEDDVIEMIDMFDIDIFPSIKTRIDYGLHPKRWCICWKQVLRCKKIISKLIFYTQLIYFIDTRRLDRTKANQLM